MIKLVIFDLDGVLVDSCDIHFHALNCALMECGYESIEYTEHIEKYNGKPTNTKLCMLSDEKGVEKRDHLKIWKLKQKKTQELIKKYTPDTRIVEILKSFKDEGYLLYCASNSIWNTVKIILHKKGFLEYIDYFISNEDVRQPKPNPEMYYNCLKRANVSLTETLIIEDSLVGYYSAIQTEAHVLKIKNSEELSYENIKHRINECDSYINIVIPMAGNGSRFANKGYKDPKPFIPVNGKPMIQWVVENLKFKNKKSKFIFIARTDHRKKYDIDTTLKSIAPGCEIIYVDDLTEGAACTVLLASKFINNTDNLIIANSDQYLEWDNEAFISKALEEKVDGLISVFESDNPKWSYAKETNGKVTLVAEKNPISNKATTGIYYWKNGRDFVIYANKMIEKNIRVNNEFYVCPVYNEAIQDSKLIKTLKCSKMWGLGTPEDLDFFLKNFF